MTDRMAPMDELAWADDACKKAARDERDTCWCVGIPHDREEAVTSRDGSREVDIMRDTAAVEDDFSILDPIF